MAGHHSRPLANVCADPNTYNFHQHLARGATPFRPPLPGARATPAHPSCAREASVPPRTSGVAPAPGPGPLVGEEVAHTGGHSAKLAEEPHPHEPVPQRPPSTHPCALFIAFTVRPTTHTRPGHPTPPPRWTLTCHCSRSALLELQQKQLLRHT